MKNHFTHQSPNTSHPLRTSMQVPNNKLPNLNKSIQITTTFKGSLQSLNTSLLLKEKLPERASVLPQINRHQKQNAQHIRQLLKEKAVNLKVAPVGRNSKTKFGWMSESQNPSPHHKDPQNKKQHSLSCSTPVHETSLPQMTKSSQFKLQLWKLNQKSDNSSQNGDKMANSPSKNRSKFSRSPDLSNGSYENLSWNKTSQQLEEMQDEINSECFEKNNLKTMRFMEADLEIEMKRRQTTSTKRNPANRQSDDGLNRSSEMDDNPSNLSVSGQDQNEKSSQNGSSQNKQNTENESQNQNKGLTKRTAKNEPSQRKIFQNQPEQQLPETQISQQTYQPKQQVGKSIINVRSNRGKKQHITELTFEVQEKSHWLQTLDQIYASFTKMGYDRAIFEKQIFLHIVKTFSQFHMDKEQKMYFLDILQKLVLINSGWQKVEDQLKYSGQLGLKLEKLANTIHFQHKQCLHNWQFIGNEISQSQRQPLKTEKKEVTFTSLKFDMDLNQIAAMAKVVEKLCVNNMDAFAFISLYFQISIDNILQEKTFKETQKQFIECLEFLKVLYPASRSQVAPQKSKPVNGNQKAEQTVKISESFGIEQIKFNHEFDEVVFDKKSSLSNFDQLKEYIQKMAKLAEKDLQVYIDLVKYSCIENGFGFKSDLKIKNDGSQIFSIMRTIEKLLTSTFGKQLEKLKDQRMQRADDELKYGSIKKFIEKEQMEVENDLKSILQRQDKIKFMAKDLVRGKCKFNTIEEIQATIKLLKENIEKKSDQGIKIIELQNRLGNNTKDVVMLIKLPNTVAELQLALKLDSVLNEFNHKIYELRRSKIYACVSNLFIRGKKWGEAFFTEQLQLFKEMSMANPTEKYGEPVCTQDIKKYVLLFQENYLKANDIKATSDKLEEYNQHRQIDEKVTLIQKGIKRGYHSLLEKKKRVDMQKENAVLFYLKNGFINRAWEIVQEFSQEELDLNPIILRLKGDILRERQEKGDEKKCIECYEKYVSLQMSENGQTIEMANVLLMLAEIKLGNRNFKQAEIYFKRCARIRQRIFKKQSIEYAMVLNRMGHMYRIQGKYDYSMKFYKRALEIIVMKSGKDSISAAEVYCSLGNACFCCGRIAESHDYYEKSLEIYKKVKGPKSIEVSILYNNMGNFYKQQLKFNEALQMYQKCLQIKQKIKGQTSLDVAYVYNNIGTLYRKFQNFIEAQKFYKMSLMIKKKAKGELSYHAASSYVDMGKFYTAKSVSKDKSNEDYETGMRYFKQALKIKRQVFKNEQNLEIADIISSIGSLYWTTKSPKALDYYKYSLQIMEKIKAKNTIEYSKVLINVGMVHQEKAKEHKEKGDRKKAQQEQIEAVRRYDKGATIEENLRGETADLAETNLTLSQLYLDMDMYQRAYDCAEKAYNIWKKIRGQDYKYTKNAFALRDKILAIKNQHKK